jgi:hypothetical protein
MDSSMEAPEKMGNADGININSDFDVDSEYKPDPLLGGGTYLCNVTKMSWNNEQQSLNLELVLDGNGGTCSDGETPADGFKLFYRLFFPKPGDDNEPTKSGRGTKRQFKINRIKKFETDTGLLVSNSKRLSEAIAGQEWIGASLVIEVTTSEYQGEVRNEVKRVKAA